MIATHDTVSANAACRFIGLWQARTMDRLWRLIDKAVAHSFGSAVIASVISFVASLLALFGLIHAAIPFVLFIVTIPVIVTSFLKGKPDHAPTPMDPTFSITGGVWLGWWNATWPLARLSGDSSALRLSCFRQDYVFHRGNILSLSKFLFGAGLLIEHTVPTYPTFVVFWVAPFRRRKRFAVLRDTLERLGYTVRA